MEDGCTRWIQHQQPPSAIAFTMTNTSEYWIFSCFCCTTCALADVRIFVENVFLLIIISIHEATQHTTSPFHSIPHRRLIHFAMVKKKRQNWEYENTMGNFFFSISCLDKSVRRSCGVLTQSQGQMDWILMFETEKYEAKERQCPKRMPPLRNKYSNQVWGNNSCCRLVYNVNAVFLYFCIVRKKQTSSKHDKNEM